jgi:DNA-binding GntR family transcriptional regulator
MSRYKTRAQIVHEVLRQEILVGTLGFGQELRQD